MPSHDRRLEARHHQQDAGSAGRRRVQDVAVDRPLSGVAPARPPRLRRAGDADAVVAVEMREQTCAKSGVTSSMSSCEKTRTSPVDLRRGAVVALGERARVVDADDLERMAGEALPRSSRSRCGSAPDRSSRRRHEVFGGPAIDGGGGKRRATTTRAACATTRAAPADRRDAPPATRGVSSTSAQASATTSAPLACAQRGLHARAGEPGVAST